MKQRAVAAIFSAVLLAAGCQPDEGQTPKLGGDGLVFPAMLDADPPAVRIDARHLPVGGAPAVEHMVYQDWDRQVVVRPDGSIAATLEVRPFGNEGYRHIAFAPYAHGWLTGWDAMGSVATLMHPDGSMGRHLGVGPFNMFSGPDRRDIVFMLEPWNRSQFLVSTMSGSGVRSFGRARSTAGFLSRDEVVVNTKASVFRIDTRTGSRTSIPGIDSASMVSSGSGLLIGKLAGTNGVFDARTGAPVLGSSTFDLESFSPSGRLVVACDRSRSRVLYAVAETETGQVVRGFRWPASRSCPGDPTAVTWEDERTFLIGPFRYRLDGGAERVGPSQGVGITLPPPIT